MRGEIKLNQQEGIVSNQLERLYTLEKVDPKTIRTYQQPVKPKIVETAYQLEPFREIGGGYPILGLLDRLDRLKLPPPLQYQLKKEGWKTIQDLLEAESQNHPKILALPSTHLNLLKGALESWKALVRVGRTTSLDFKGYFSGLGSSSDPIAYLALLDALGLMAFMETTSYERIQVERLSAKERDSLIKSAIEQIELNEEIEEIFSGLLFGWLEERGGLTCKEEVIERLEQESMDKGAAKGFIRLLEMNNRLPGFFKDNLWFFNRSLKKNVEEMAYYVKGFFYKPKMTYDLVHLQRLIQKELLKTGELLDELFLKRYLLLSKGYRLERRDLVNYFVHDEII